MKYFAVLAAVSVCTVATCATTYRWIDTNRPPVSLAAALGHVDKTLGGEHAKYYCIGGQLYGDKEGDAEAGFWNLTYAAEDGSRKFATVTMQGETYLENRNGPIDWAANQGRRSNLKDVQSRLLAVLESHELPPDKIVKENDETVTLHVSTREYSVHKLQDDGVTLQAHIQRLDQEPMGYGFARRSLNIPSRALHRLCRPIRIGTESNTTTFLPAEIGFSTSNCDMAASSRAK